MAPVHPFLTAGERLPDFVLPPQEGMTDTFYTRHCGRPAALILAREALQFERFAALADSTAVLGLCPGRGGDPIAAAIPAMHDHGSLTLMLGLGDHDSGPIALILDETLRLRCRLDDPAPEAIRSALPELAQASGADARLVIGRHAPVLIVPGMLETSLCAQLIAAHAADNAESGMVRVIDGQPALVPDPRAKKRRDHRLTSPDLVTAVTDALSRRVLPEVAAAFNYPVTRFEGLKIASYDSGYGGYFRLHRDNVTPDVRHRRFALTVNLDDDYDGGCLRFPEYGHDLYRPPAGGAIVFSGALLHEVTDVTRGRRHVLLTFMWGDEAVS